MKSHSIALPNIESRASRKTLNPAGQLNRFLCMATKAFVAAVPALALVVGAAWVIGAPELLIYLQASVWALGFVFIGLAIDSGKRASVLAALTGIALPVLAILSAKVAVEFALVAVVLIAAWVAVAIFRH